MAEIENLRDDACSSLYVSDIGTDTECALESLLNQISPNNPIVFSQWHHHYGF